MQRILTNPISGVRVEILKSTTETNGAFFQIHSTMKANQMNKAPFHYHTKFYELFKVEKGQLNMILGKERKNITLQKNESILVNKKVPHTFWNESDLPVTYSVTIKPARQFEKALRINHALAASGKASNKGTPKNIFHIAVLALMANTRFYGFPRLLQYILFTILSFVAIILGVKRKILNLR